MVIGQRNDEDLDMLEEVNGQHFMMYHQQCYSLFTNKVGLERAEKRREKAVIQAETFNEPPAKKRATRKRMCWLRCVVVRHNAWGQFVARNVTSHMSLMSANFL
jgi:hypothetical protein